MEIAFIAELIQHLQQSTIEEMELRGQGCALRLKAEQTRPSGGALPASKSQTLDSDKQSNKLVIRATALGFFENQHPSNEQPFVAQGSEARVGDIVGLVRQGRFFSVVRAETEGHIGSMLKQNGETVAFGDVLFELNARERSYT